MAESAKIQVQKEKIARISASRIKQLAKSLADIAKEAANPIYTDRVIGEEFQGTLEQAFKLAKKLSDIVVPKDSETGYADAKKLVQAVVSHAFRSEAPPKKAKSSEKTATAAKDRTSKTAKRQQA